MICVLTEIAVVIVIAGGTFRAIDKGLIFGLIFAGSRYDKRVVFFKQEKPLNNLIFLQVAKTFQLGLEPFLADIIFLVRPRLACLLHGFRRGE